jgi:peroxiredoxin
VLKPGDRAPDFPLKFRTLYDLLGESAGVLFFFPKAFTPG